ncbi:MAG: group II intron reverse transcriptase/maturase [Gemmataceae bacterium]|nr:group II intron reverse transcriptase/maturase [Gemmataceae bacterium]
MRKAEAVLNIIEERGQRGLPLERVYRLLFLPDLYLRAYSRLYANKGAMTRGATSETVDGMSMARIETIIEALREERYRWTPVRRTYIPKKNGKLRPLGMPSWSDKLLQEVIRSILNAYYEPQFSKHSHGFRPKRGCHTALREVVDRGAGTKWFIEGDISACFDKIDHSIVLAILRERIHDNRFLRLIDGLLQAGYLEDWTFNATYSGVPQGGVVSPILSNLVLDRLDKFVENELIPSNTRGRRRKTYPPYVAMTVAAARARKRGDREMARELSKTAQRLPSRDPEDPNFRRLWYVRYADDFLLGFIGPKAEAEEIKERLARYLRDTLHLDLSMEKTLVTHARDDVARFLGYEVHCIHADDQHDPRGQRGINGRIGLRVPHHVIRAAIAKYMRGGKPTHLPQRLNDDVYSIVRLYQSEYSGIVQYYRLAYNLGKLSHFGWAAWLSLVKTLANKLRCHTSEVTRRYRTRIMTPEGSFSVLQVVVERGPKKKPLKAHFGGISLAWNLHASIGDTPTKVWSGRSELLGRLLAEECELCRSTSNIEVHHVRKLADLRGRSQWEKVMVARRRKTLVVCRSCHDGIHNGRYNGPALRKITGEPDDTETVKSGSEGRGWKSA